MPDKKEQEKVLVVFTPSGKRGQFNIGTPILDAARELGVYVESVCGGRGICGRCQVEPQFGKFAKHAIEVKENAVSEVSFAEKRYIVKRGELKQGRRLSCSTTIQGPLVVDIPPDAQVHAQTIRKDADERFMERNPAIQMCYVEVEEPDMHKPLGDLDRLKIALKEQWGFENLQIKPSVLRSLQKILRDAEWKVTVAIHQDAEGTPLVLMGIYPGLKNDAYGIACDIGSTTLAMHLISLLSGRIIASAGASNPQIRFGEDLMSRVSYVMMNPEGQQAMTKAVRETINELIGEICEKGKVEKNDILNAVFVGNPIMHHLFLGLDPVPVGSAPFALGVSQSFSMDAEQLELDMNKGGEVYMLPCIAGHVGADAAAATLCHGPHRQDKIMLMVDIGTNAEIVLGNKDRLLAASSPTGPAFEGAEISCGQRAAPGAIERVRIDAETLEVRIKVIGIEMWSDEKGFEEEAEKIGITGICGSAIIEVIAELYLAKVISKDGVIRKNENKRIFETGRTYSFMLWEGKGDNPDITVSQNDVRAIQLAKAALYAGVRLLMDKLGVENVDAIALAGAFGTFIDPKYALVLGLIPDCEVKNVEAIGNAAGVGACMALLNRENRREIEKTVTEIEKIETALEEKFQEHFVNAMAFPNKIEKFEKLSKEVKLPVEEEQQQQSDKNDTTPRRRRRRKKAMES